MIKSRRRDVRGACRSHETQTNKEIRFAYRVWTGKHEGRKLTERLTCRWKDDIKVDRKDRRTS